MREDIWVPKPKLRGARNECQVCGTQSVIPFHLMDEEGLDREKYPAGRRTCDDDLLARGIAQKGFLLESTRERCVCENCWGK